MKVVVSWSGGKDSQACLIWAVEKYGADNVEAVFCDTGWEHDKTYRHVDNVANALGVKLVKVKSNKYDGFVDMSIKKGRVPSARARFCTEELKIKPMIDYILSQEDNLLVIQGIRADESASRSLMEKQCRFFKYYFEPHSSNSITIEMLDGKDNLTEKQSQRLDKAKKRLSEGKEDRKFHSYRKKDVIEWCKKYSDDILRPIFEWDANETINYCIDKGNGIPLNPLYYMGAGRVGCYPCVMCNKGELRDIFKSSPEVIDKIRDLEKKANGSFFSPNYVPDRYLRQVSDKGNKYPSIDDVVDYIRDKNATGNLFEQDDDSDSRCMSVYNICE